MTVCEESHRPHRKVQGHNPMMNGHGKSHSPIVPTKLPNKAAKAVAEAVEGRGLAKGKTLEHNRSRTQSRQILSSTPERIREGEDGSEHRYHSYSSATSASRPKARAGCGNPARPDPCGGPPARAVPTATSSESADKSRQGVVNESFIQ
jgi:hypothetical protein